MGFKSVPRGWRDRGSLWVLSRNGVPDFKLEGLCRGIVVASIHSILTVLIIRITPRVPILGARMVLLHSQ